MIYLADRRGLAGTVIDGGCRDTHLALELIYSIFSRSYSMLTGKNRVQLETVQSAVTIGDARVPPGDIVRGDSDGVIVSPQSREAAVLDTAEIIHTTELRIRQDLADCLTLTTARRGQNYHLLQRRG